MSASLVGSEMCIRDSLQPSATPRSRPQPSAALRSPVQLSAALRSPAQFSAAPVSYTHLRAHETSAHL
eukprot:4477570-Alexandrium_andersonii.AAC.1